MKRRVWMFAAILLLMSGAPGMASEPGYDRVTGRLHASRSEVIAPHGMAATSQPLATQIALDILKAGGSAVDAAIAANAALGLMEPTGNGIGGDLFAIVWDAENGKLHGLNASGRSPKTLTLDYFREQGLEKIPAYGPLPVSVPGTVDGWFELHGRFGTLPMSEILAPTIAYAREGHPVHETIAHYWARSVDRLSKYPGFREQMTIDGRAPRIGELWRNPNLANTLERIAREGREVFYRGEIARVIGHYMQANGGFLSYEDLAAHRSEWVEPVSVNYRGYDVWELPPNGQGIAALQILNILEQFDVAQMGFGSADHVHLFLALEPVYDLLLPGGKALPVAHRVADPQREAVARHPAEDHVVAFLRALAVDRVDLDELADVIARRADVAAGTVLYHYPDPDDLVRDVMADMSDYQRGDKLVVPQSANRVISRSR